MYILYIYTKYVYCIILIIVGGILVYSKPLSKPKKFSVGKWKFTLGVHPKHVHELTVERYLYLLSLIDLPNLQ